VSRLSSASSPSDFPSRELLARRAASFFFTFNHSTFLSRLLPPSMGLLTVLRKVKQKERELRVLIV